MEPFVSKADKKLKFVEQCYSLNQGEIKAKQPAYTALKNEPTQLRISEHGQHYKLTGSKPSGD